MTLWAAQWHSRNKTEGDKKHICYENCMPVIFRTRAEARKWIELRYGFIKTRPDLKQEPHGWRLPRAIKVGIIEL